MTDFHNNNVPFARKTTVQPIIEDAPCYCRPCEYQFASRQCYRRHLITIHKMKLEPLQKCKPTLKARPNIVPVVDDPTNTCISCGYQFFQERNYRLHLINVHKMKLDTLQNSIPRLKAQPNITPVVDDPNYMCRSCIYQFSSKQSYKRHLTTVHNMKLSHKCRARPDIMPDVNDPNNTCRSCGDHRFANKITYRSHLIRIHNMDLEPLRCSRSNIIPQSNVSPVIDDPNYICRSCIYQFSSKQGYKRHLIAIHKVKLEPPRKGKPKLKPKPNITPVVDDPNNNCRSCNYQFTSKNGYRGHLLRTHKMKLKPSERSMPKLIPQPNILPVVDDPESNCRSCNHRFSSKQWYRSHLVNVHKMDLDLLSVEKLKVRQSISPVVDDPNNNCRPCNYQFSSKQAYRTHLIKVHKIKLESLRSNISRRR
jgi:transposase-like protein